MQLGLILCLILLNFCDDSSAANSKSSTTTSELTCASRTINYITHSLPQQCLPSSWRASSSRNRTSSETTVIVHGSSVADSKSVAKGTSIISSLRDPTTSTTVVVQSTPRIQTAETLAQPAQDRHRDHSSIFSAPPSTITVVSDDGSSLEDGDFLSFEEWKKRNLRKVGQSEHIGADLRPGQKEAKKRSHHVQHSLESLGDEAEIDIDFSGFVPDGPDISSVKQSSKEEDDMVQNESEAAPRPKSRSREAGKTSKERFNYASLDCAANVLKTNPQAKSAPAVLGENKDSYMLNECSAKNKFIIIELCNDISIDTIVVANFEFFSSIFRTFKVSVSDKYPVKADKWEALGIFEARNSRNVQAFLIENPVIWARYLRIEFLTHYGNEYYCPVSLIRVHGRTMLEEYKHDMEQLQAGEDDEEAEEDESEVDTADRRTSEDAATSRHEIAEDLTTADVKAQEDHISSSEVGSQISHHSTSESRTSTFKHKDEELFDLKHTCWIPTVFEHNSTCHMHERPVKKAASSKISSSSTHTTRQQTLSSKSTQTSSKSSLSASGNSATMSPTNKQNKISSTSSKSSSTRTTVSVKGGSVSVHSDRPRTSTATHSHPPAPTMQESFFKSVQKRLQMLEANSSLSLQYIEDQSRALRDAFMRVEQRQLSRTSIFLEYLNTTVINELREFRQQYDQLWQSTVIELETQQERWQKENGAMNERLVILADELVFQKRMTILQMFLILICLGLVLFSRTSIHNYLETPLVQSVLWRSPSFRNPGSPAQSPLARIKGVNMKPRNKNGILKSRRHLQAEESHDETFSQSELYSPPTPVSFGDISDAESLLKDTPSPEPPPPFDPLEIERPSTSPPVLIGGEGAMNENEPSSIDARLMNGVDTPTGLGLDTSRLLYGDATPPAKHLTWSLSES